MPPAKPIRRRAPRRPLAGTPSPSADRWYGIGELSAEFGLTARAIRFYEQRGLISPRRDGASRLYSRRDRARLMLILRGKNLGFSLEEIAEYLSLYDADPGQIAQTRHLLEKIDAAVAGLVEKRSDLDRTLRELESIRDSCLRHLADRKET